MCAVVRNKAVSGLHDKMIGCSHSGRSVALLWRCMWCLCRCAVSVRRVAVPFVALFAVLRRSMLSACRCRLAAFRGLYGHSVTAGGVFCRWEYACHVRRLVSVPGSVRRSVFPSCDLAVCVLWFCMMLPVILSAVRRFMACRGSVDLSAVRRSVFWSILAAVGLSLRCGTAGLASVKKSGQSLTNQREAVTVTESQFMECRHPGFR